MPLYQLKCSVKASEGDFLFIEDGVVKAVIPSKEMERAKIPIQTPQSSPRVHNRRPIELLEAQQNNIFEVISKSSSPISSTRILEILEIPTSDTAKRSSVYDDLSNMSKRGLINKIKSPSGGLLYTSK